MGHNPRVPPWLRPWMEVLNVSLLTNPLTFELIDVKDIEVGKQNYEMEAPKNILKFNIRGHGSSQVYVKWKNKCVEVTSYVDCELSSFTPKITQITPKDVANA